MQDPYNSDDYGDVYDDCDDNAIIIHCKPNNYAIIKLFIILICLLKNLDPNYIFSKLCAYPLHCEFINVTVKPYMNYSMYCLREPKSGL